MSEHNSEGSLPDGSIASSNEASPDGSYASQCSLKLESDHDEGRIQVAAVAAIGVVVVILMLIVYKLYAKRSKKDSSTEPVDGDVQSQLVHKLCPHNNVVQSFEVQQKDSLDEHLDQLTRKLAEKEGRLRISKSKIRQTQNEIENLQAIDHDVHQQYRLIMESLRTDLLSNEKECKKLQEQIEWVSRRRAELKEEVRRGQKLYGEAAAELASNLAELQKGRDRDTKVIDKPQQQQSNHSLRRRKEPQLPRAEPMASIVIKTPPGSPPTVASRISSQYPPRG